MPRKYTSLDYLLKEDPVYNSLLLGKLINKVMVHGKKTVAQGIVYRALETIKEKIKDKEPIDVLKKAIDNVKPILEVRPRRVGGATYQVPMEVDSKRQQTLAFRWLVGVASSKKGKPMHVKFAEEILAAYKGEGEAMKKRENMHKMAESNRAFAHFAW